MPREYDFWVYIMTNEKQCKKLVAEKIRLNRKHEPTLV